jgi:hypothetical protein
MAVQCGALGIVCAGLLTPVPAAAQSSDADRALAESLFETGRKLMTEKKYAEACPKLAESFRLDPTTGTLLNLAVCHRDEGRIASAWAEFKDAAALARRDGRADREQFAQEQVAALEPRLPRLTISVAGGAEAEGLSVSRDGTALGQPVWGVPIAVDPGKHAIVATAPGRRKWETTIEIGERENKTVTVPALEVDPSAGTTAETGTPPPQPTAGTGDSGPAPEPGVNKGKRTASYIAFGVGAVGLGVGTIFGINAMSKKSDSDDNCTPGCNQTGVDLSEDARTAARISTVGFGVGLVGIGVGTWLLLTSGSAETSPTAAKLPAKARSLYVDPIVGQGTLRLQMGGTW